MNTTEQNFLGYQTQHFGVVLLLHLCNSRENPVRLWRQANVRRFKWFAQFLIFIRANGRYTLMFFPWRRTLGRRWCGAPSAVAEDSCGLPEKIRSELGTGYPDSRFDLYGEFSGVFTIPVLKVTHHLARHINLVGQFLLGQAILNPVSL